MTPQQSPTVLSSQSGRVALVTLNRPQVINAVNMEMRSLLPATLLALDADPQVGAIVLAGSGERGFCAGADIKEVRSAPTSVGERQRLMPRSWIESIDQLRKPVVAALHGICMGAGLELALACDIRIAARDVRMALPETGLGVIPGGGGTQRLPRLIGIGRALDMILTGDELDARRACDCGLVTRLEDTREAALQAALKLAERLTERAPLATAFAKEAIVAGAAMPLQDGLRLEKSLYAILATTQDRLEAAAAFRDKRKPEFSGE